MGWVTALLPCVQHLFPPTALCNINTDQASSETDRRLTPLLWHWPMNRNYSFTNQSHLRHTFLPRFCCFTTRQLIICSSKYAKFEHAFCRSSSHLSHIYHLLSQRPCFILHLRSRTYNISHPNPHARMLLCFRNVCSCVRSFRFI